MMRKILIFCLALILNSITPSAFSATAPSSAIKLSEVDCNADWLEIANTNASLSLNLRNFSVLVIETDSGEVQDSFYLPGFVLKAGKSRTFDSTALGFGIGCGDESVILQDSKGKELDRVAVPNLLDGFSWSRSGNFWGGGVPTKGKSNILVESDTPIDKAAWIFDQFQSFRINLTISEENINNLVQDPKTYVPATFRFRDANNVLLPESGALSVGVRTKGSVGSTGGGQINIQNGKIGLKIKFNEYVPGQKFLGLKRLTLNNMLQDPSMVREALSYQLFRDMGLIAPRTGFAKVYIDSGSGFQYKGLYLNLESYDEIMMARWRSTMQHMYDATWAPGWNSQSKTCSNPQWNRPEITVSHFRCNFEVDRGDPEDTTDLEDLAYAIDDQEKLTSEAKKMLNIKQVGKFFATEKYISHWDGMSGSPEWTPNNFRMYSDKNSNFELLPWGTDGTWYQFQSDSPWSPSGMVDGLEPFDSAQSQLFNQCGLDDECKSEYLKALAQLSQLADYAEFANDLFEAHRAARESDTVRLADELSSAWELNQTLNFIDMRKEMALDFVQANATGAIRWQPPKKTLNAGSKLTAATLNAYSDVLGSFKYSKKVGTGLKKGFLTIKVTFTPNDLDTWSIQEKTIKFRVK